MDAKKLFTTFVGIFVLVFLSLSLASAAVQFTPTSISSSITQGASNNFNILLENDATQNLTNVQSYKPVLTSGANTIASSNIQITSVPPYIEGNQNETIVLQVSVPSSQATGTYTGNLTIEGTYTNPANYTLPVSITVNAQTTTSSCVVEFGVDEDGDLTIDDLDVDNAGEGDDDEWFPLDEIEITVDVENTHQDDEVEDVIVEIFVYDGTEDVTNDFDFEDEKIDLGDVREDDTETATFNLNELPTDINEGTYELRVLVYSDNDEETHCVSDVFEFTVDREFNDAVIAKDGDISSSVEAETGEQVTLSFNVYNIGEDEEDEVLVQLFNSELGLNELVHLENLDSGDKEEVTYLIRVPENAVEKTYFLDVITYFQYDDGDILSTSSYDENSDDDLEETYRINLRVIDTTPETPELTIDAQLMSEAKVGEDLVVEVTLENDGDEEQTFIISAEAFESWAELDDIEPQVLTIDAGDSETTTITFTPTEAGTKTFRVVASAAGMEDVKQTISVNVSEDESFFSNLFSGFAEGSAVSYLIAGIILLLVVIVIVLIVKIARTPGSASEF